MDEQDIKEILPLKYAKKFYELINRKEKVDEKHDTVGLLFKLKK